MNDERNADLAGLILGLVLGLALFGFIAVAISHAPATPTYPMLSGR